MPSEQELQAIDNFLQPPEPIELEKVSNDEVPTDYFKNTIYNNDGIYQVVYWKTINGANDLIKGKMRTSAILTHDTLTDFLEDETDNYESIKYLGLGEEYMKEVCT